MIIFSVKIIDSGFQNGPHTLAKFSNLWGISLNPNDNCLYICDYGESCIRVINAESIAP